MHLCKWFAAAEFVAAVEILDEIASVAVGSLAAI